MSEMCDDCGGKGWDVYNEDENGWGEVQPCDTCRVFCTDEDALESALRSGRVRQGVQEV